LGNPGKLDSLAFPPCPRPSIHRPSFVKGNDVTTRLVRAAELGRLAGVHRRTVYHWYRQGYLTGIETGAKEVRFELPFVLEQIAAIRRVRTERRQKERAELNSYEQTEITQ